MLIFTALKAVCLSVCLSFYLSVKLLIYDKTEESSVQIFYTVRKII